MNNIKLIIVDNEVADMYALIQTLKKNPRFTIIKTFINGIDFLNQIKSLPEFDCAVINKHMPLMSGMEIAEELKNQNINFKIYITTYGIFPSMVSLLTNSGAHAFTRKDPPLVELMIPRIVAGDVIYEDQEKHLWVVNNKSYTMFELEQKIWLTLLNRSEKAILHGYANKTALHIISRDSEIDLQTLDKYKKRILKKLKLQTDEQLTEWAINNGFKNRT